MEKLNKIALVGSTGKAGLCVVNELLRKGYRLRVLLRNPDRFKIKSSLIEVVEGDVRDADSVYRLLKGCDVVVSTLGQTKGEPPVYVVAVNNIIEAMLKLGIKRYLSVTGLTLDVEGDKKSFRNKLLTKIMKMSFPAIVADKQNEFSVLVGSCIDWTVVRLPLIKQINSVGEVKINLSDCPGKYVSATGLACFLVAHMYDDTYFKKAPFIAN